MTEETVSVTLRDVYEDMEAIPFLYELLRQRDIDTVSLSHRVMPSVRAHIDFVMSKPYDEWRIIIYRGMRVGTIYLTERNEIGIDILKDYRRIGIGKAAIYWLKFFNSRPYYLANINPKNGASLALFRKCGFVDFQVTLRYNAADRKVTDDSSDHRNDEASLAQR